LQPEALSRALVHIQAHLDDELSPPRRVRTHSLELAFVNHSTPKSVPATLWGELTAWSTKPTASSFQGGGILGSLTVLVMAAVPVSGGAQRRVTSCWPVDADNATLGLAPRDQLAQADQGRGVGQHRR